MHAHPQPGRGTGGLDAPGKRGPVGQERCAGHNPVMEGLDDAAIYASRPSQVIRIDDQILHSLFCFLVFTCPLGQLPICATDEIRTIDRFGPQL